MSVYDANDYTHLALHAGAHDVLVENDHPIEGIEGQKVPPGPPLDLHKVALQGAGGLQLPLGLPVLPAP